MLRITSLKNAIHESPKDLFIYRSNENFRDTIEEDIRQLGRRIPVVCCSHEPTYWGLSTVPPETVARA